MSTSSLRWLFVGLAFVTLAIITVVVRVQRSYQPEMIVGAHSNEPVAEAVWVPNAVVSDVLVTDDTIYAAGSFSRLGPYTGAGLPLDTTTGAVIEPHATVAPDEPLTPAITSVVADGAGGWYVGGGLEDIDGVARAGLAHLLPNGLVDGDFTVGTDGQVESLLKDGTTLYVGGSFSTLGGQPRSGLGAINLTTGTVTSWDPSVEPGAPVTDMALSGTTLFIGGDFASVDGDGRNNLAAIDTTATVAGTYTTAWNPNADGMVFALLLDGTTLYIGGEFDIVDSVSRINGAAIDTTATVAGTYTTAWDPAPDGSAINALAKSGSTVFAGGNFLNIGGAARSRLAGLDATTGLATSFDANIDATGGNVYSLQLSGSTLYLGGDFVLIDGQARPFLAAVDLTGALQAFDPRGCDSVIAMAVQGSQIYTGGNFPCMGSEEHYGLVALDRTTGAPRSWNPLNEFTVMSALTTDGSVIYVGGTFTSIGGQARNNIAAIDPVTGLATSWNPNASARVLDLEYRDGTVYAAGTFLTIGGESRNRIAALSTATGLATSWDPNANSRVDGLYLADDVMYAFAGSGFGPGGFTSIGGQPRNRLAALDLTTGLATDWNPTPNNYVQSATRSGNTVYVGGGFSSIGGETRNFLAAVDATTGLATDWAPEPNAAVNRVFVDDGALYVGGLFSSIAGESRSVLASFATATGELSPWNPNATATGSLPVLDFVTGSPVLIVGGQFSLPGLGTSNLKVFSLTTVEFVEETLEGAQEETTVELPVALSDIEAIDTLVDYVVTGGTAVAGQDYILDPGTLTIDAGETEGAIPMTILSSSAGQPDKTVEVTLTNPSINAVLGEKTVLTFIIQGTPAPQAVQSPQRFGGDTPQEQAIAMSQQRFAQTGSAAGAVIARSKIAVDGFTSGPLANRGDFTLLITNSNELEAAVATELQRALNDTGKPVYLAGGEEALEPAIVTRLQQLGFTSIERFNGANRSHTARLIASKITALNTVVSNKIFLTEKSALVDALTIGAIAGQDPLNQKVTPILVTSRESAALDSDVVTFLQEHPEVTQVEIIGGTVAVTEAAEFDLKTRFPSLQVARTSGANRFATNKAIIEKFFNGPTAIIAARGDTGGIPGAQSIGAASQDDTQRFFSALLATTFAADRQIPLVLVTPTNVPQEIVDYVTANKATIVDVFILGSLSQISQAVEDHLRALAL
jgi:putative cell wall-binding protein